MGFLDKLFGSEEDKPDISQLFSKAGEGILNSLSEQIKSENISWLENKRTNFKGGDYITQLEKNAIYAVESLMTTMSALTTFIVTEVEINNDFIMQHMQNAQGISRDMVEFHLNYLNDGCDGCIAHTEHNRYVGLKNIKSSGDVEKYINELEFWCIYYRAMQTFGMAYIEYFMKNRNMFSKFKGFDEGIVSSELEKYTKLYANLCINNIEIN